MKHILTEDIAKWNTDPETNIFPYSDVRNIGIFCQIGAHGIQRPWLVVKNVWISFWPLVFYSPYKYEQNDVFFKEIALKMSDLDGSNR